MSDATTVAGLERLAASDPAIAPLARLQAVAFRAADDSAWAEGLAGLHPGASGAGPAAEPPTDGVPLLHGLTLSVDPDRQRALLRELAATLAEIGSAGAGQLVRAVAASDFDPLMLLHASLTQQAASIEEIAETAGVEPALLAVVGHVATLPLLLTCGRQAAEAVRSRPWSPGYCPVCAAWPTLAEMRGLARDLFLRCGRCASEWPCAHDACPFCGSREPGARSYLAAERDRESQRAVTCDGCHGYLKALATLRALSPAELLLRDLQTVELDVAALDSGYARPEQPGWELAVHIESAVRAAGGWLRRWR